MKKTKKKGVFLAILLIILVGMMMVMIIDDVTVALTNYDVYSPKLPLPFYGYRILCISDFHNSFYPGQISKIVNEEQPDLVLFLGDMTVLPENDFGNVQKLLDGITADVPIYGILGNHETWTKKQAQVEEELTKSKIKLLKNEKVTITRGNATIDLIGINDPADVATEEDVPNSYFYDEMRTFLNNTVDPSTYTILACHRPAFFSDFSMANLMLSGHTHGGGLRLPFLGGVFDVDGGFFPKYDGGLYQGDTGEMVVSRGADFQFPKLRIFNGPEVVMVTLRR